MRKLFYSLILLPVMLLSSCDGEAKLGKQIAGEWSAGSSVIPGIEAANAVITDTFNFIPDSGYKAGEVQITGVFTITLADNAMMNTESAESTIVNGKSVVYGKYTVTSHDDLLMNLAIDSIALEFDPSTVIADSNTLAVDSVATGGVTTAQLQVLKAQLLGTLQAKYAALRVLDDVKVKGNQMEFEVLDTDYLLTR